MTDLSNRESIGGNNPPADPFVAQLEEKHGDLNKRQGDLEMRRLRLPKVVETEEQAGQITAWVVEARALGREVEARRVDVKEPYLRRGNTIDIWFGALKGLLKGNADAIEARNGPYLKAKQDRERAAAAERARIAREAAEKAQREVDAARVKEETARREREAEEARMREAEKASQRRAEQTEQAAAESAARAEAALRAAHIEQERQAQARQQAEDFARKASQQADRAERQASNGTGLGKSTAGGGSAKATMVIVGRVDSWPAVIQSLGVLGPYFNEQIVRDAIDRAARDPNRPGTVPGVTFQEQLAVKTTASRTGA